MTDQEEPRGTPHGPPSAIHSDPLTEWVRAGIELLHQAVTLARLTTDGTLTLQAALWAAQILELDVLRWRREQDLARRTARDVTDFVHEVHRITVALRHHQVALMIEGRETVHLARDPALDDLGIAVRGLLQRAGPMQENASSMDSNLAPLRAIGWAQDRRRYAHHVLQYATQLVRQLQLPHPVSGSTGGMR